ncbi:MAG: multicopper oxidase domain-containing protein [Bauldia sp.]|nr:multicopper oxidase domain-containing protein [Bauldia sp.]
MTVSRRELLVGAAAVACASTMPARSSFAQAAPLVALPALSVLDARETLAFALDAVPGQTEFVAGVPSETLGFNQSYLGPVVLLPSTATVRAAVTNRTDRTVSVHWHGLLVPGEIDGGPHQPIAPGETWSPTLPIDQARATLWFHTHVHGATAEGIYAGLAGVLLLDDGLDARRGLPAALGVDDLVLVIQDKRLDASGRAVYEPTSDDRMHGFLGDTILVNGAITPVAAVPAGIVKLRLLNAANARNLDLFFEDGRAMHIVASDQGLLPTPVRVNRLRLAPGERSEVLVDFSNAGTATLLSRPHAEGTGAGGMGHDMAGMGGMAGMVANEERFTAPFVIATFRPEPDLPVAIRSVPATLGPDEPVTMVPSATRPFVLNDMGNLVPPVDLLDALRRANTSDHAGHAMSVVGSMPGMAMPAGNAAPSADPVFGINGAPFDMARINFGTTLGMTERWIVGGEMMGHPFHVHGTRFRVIRDKDGQPRPENQGWKDTVFVDGEVELLVEFRSPAPATAAFMFHCHVLEHEDRGMMGQFTVGA